MRLWTPQNGKPPYHVSVASKLDPAHPLNQGLVAWWLFNESGGVNIRNSVTGLLGAPYAGAPAWSGGNLSLNGSTYYRAWVNSFPTVFTILASIKSTTTLDYVLAGYSNTTGRWRWYLDGPGMKFYTEGGAWSTESATVNGGVWTSICAVLDGTNCTQYVNGAQSTQGAQAPLAGNIVHIGSLAGTGTFLGDMAYVGLYARALSTAEVLQWHYFPYGAKDNPRFLVPSGRRWFIPAAGGTQYTASLNGAIAPSATITWSTIKLYSGALTPAGLLTSAPRKLLAGSLTPAGVTVLRTIKQLTGTLTLSGLVVSKISKAFSGALAPAGVLAKRAGKSMAGALTPSATLANLKVALLALAGAITPSGTITRSIRKQLAGTINQAGGVAKKVSKTLAGSLTPAGALAVSKVILLALAGTVSSAGTLARRTGKALSGSVTPVGVISKLITRILTGVLGLVGDVANSIVGALLPASRVVFKPVRTFEYQCSRNFEFNPYRQFEFMVTE